jgi:hypothetical protein
MLLVLMALPLAFVALRGVGRALWREWKAMID